MISKTADPSAEFLEDGEVAYIFKALKENNAKPEFYI